MSNLKQGERKNQNAALLNSSILKYQYHLGVIFLSLWWLSFLKRRKWSLGCIIQEFFNGFDLGIEVMQLLDFAAIDIKARYFGLNAGGRLNTCKSSGRGCFGN